MKNDLSDLEHLLAEDCAEHPVSAVWGLILAAVIAVPLLLAMLRS